MICLEWGQWVKSTKNKFDCKLVRIVKNLLTSLFCRYFAAQNLQNLCVKQYIRWVKFFEVGMVGVASAIEDTLTRLYNFFHIRLDSIKMYNASRL